MQTFCYDLLPKEGAIVILEKESGKIIALTQSNGSSSYDANELDVEMVKQLSEQEGYFLDRSYQISEAVGSTFKAFMTGLMLENGKEGTRYLDQGSIKVEGLVTSNDSGKAYGNIGLQEALTVSSNVYFINAGVNVLGKDIVAGLEKKFLLNQNIETDLGILHATFDLKTDYSEAKLGQTSFGQGEVAISPLYLAMMYQGLATGSMKKPYIVEKAVTKRGKTVYKAEIEELSQPFEAEVCEHVSEYLKKVATDGYGMDAKLNVRAKTGTATITEGVHHTYVASYDDKFVVVISDQRATESSHKLAEEKLPKIYEKLHEIYDYEKDSAK